MTTKDDVLALPLKTILQRDYHGAVIKESVKEGSYLASVLYRNGSGTYILKKVLATVGESFTVGDAVAMTQTELSARIGIADGGSSLEWLEAYLHLFGLTLKDTTSIFAMGRAELMAMDFARRQTTEAETKASLTGDAAQAFMQDRTAAPTLAVPAEIRQIPVNTIEFSVRVANCLKCENIETLGQLASRTEAELMRTPNFGHLCLQEVQNCLSAFGLRLGMDLQ